MANTANTTVNNAGPAGEWGKRRNAGESNTWNNAMAHPPNNDYDWGGEEDWSKVTLILLEWSRIFSLLCFLVT